MNYVVSALYHFVDLPNPGALRTLLHCECLRLGIQGTLLVASEGINGTVAGSRASIDSLTALLRAQPGLQQLVTKESRASQPPFLRLKVKLKKEIVTMRVDGIRPVDRVGQYVEPEQWNELISRPDVTVIDTRNAFEYRVGHFEGATDPSTASFADFPDYVRDKLDPTKQRHVAMYCTGGIRCEKATSYLLDQGFENVYHLKGGILRYLERVSPEDSRWHGECFVFDRRTSVTHGLAEGSFVLCYGCHAPLSRAEQEHPEYEPEVSCLYCSDTLTDARRQQLRERAKQVRMAQER